MLRKQGTLSTGLVIFVSFVVMGESHATLGRWRRRAALPPLVLSPGRAPSPAATPSVPSPASASIDSFLLVGEEPTKVKMRFTPIRTSPDKCLAVSTLNLYAVKGLTPPVSSIRWQGPLGNALPVRAHFSPAFVKSARQTTGKDVFSGADYAVFEMPKAFCDFARRKNGVAYPICSRWNPDSKFQALDYESKSVSVAIQSTPPETIPNLQDARFQRFVESPRAIAPSSPLVDTALNCVAGFHSGTVRTSAGGRRAVFTSGKEFLDEIGALLEEARLVPEIHARVRPQPESATRMMNHD